MRIDTIFDIASITKLFTSLVIMRLVEDGAVCLDRPVAGYLPEFTEDHQNGGALGKESVTVRQLLVHTSGFPAQVPIWSDYPDPPARIRGVLTAPLGNAPGTEYCYSDLNLITIGELARRVDGRPLDRLVTDLICRPLRMADTGFCPGPGLVARIAATEDERVPSRGLVCGQVHDENAWALGGVAGHAGLFSTAADLAVLAQTIINGGSYRGHQILHPDTLRQMLTNQIPQFPGHDHGLGFELNQPRYMGRLAGPHTCGHTGFTGTSMVIDIDRQMFVILLTNRVHPSRDWGGINPARAMIADAVADELDVT
jgi:CubicO group peptidase (beta-lactamase class C family)